MVPGWGSHTIQKCRLNKTGIDPSRPDRGEKAERSNAKRPKEAQPIDLEKDDYEMVKKGKASIFTTPDGQVRPNPKWGEEHPRSEAKKRPQPSEGKDADKKEKKEHKERSTGRRRRKGKTKREPREVL